MLVLFYYLSQNPDFAESVKPLMSQLKDSEQMLNFLKDLSNFSQTFSAFQNEQKNNAPPSKEEHANKDEPKNSETKNSENEKTPQSPTSGIADDFIQNILENYLKKH